MRALPKIALFFLASFIIVSTHAFAGWGPNVRLTYRGNEIMPQVIARGDTVHVVWRGYGTVSYIRSTNGGETWGNIMDLNTMGHTASSPTLNLDERGLLVSWLDNDTIMDITTIGIAKSTNNGSSWSQPSYVYTENPNHFGLPVSAVKGDSIFLVYYTSRDDSTGLSPFKSMHSYNYGQTWSEEVTVGHPYILMPQPIKLRYCFGTLLLAWSGTADSSRRNEVHIYGYRSTDAGRTWSDTIWISPNSQYDAQLPCESCNKITGQMVVGYMDYRYQIYAFYGDIFASISNDGGAGWPFETQASVNHAAAGADFDFIQDTLIAAWGDIQYNISGYPEIVFNRSNDGGLNWQGEYRLTDNDNDEGGATLSMSNSNIHVVWSRDVEGLGYEIFYMRFTPDSSQDIVEPEKPPLRLLSISAYPNPFNSDLMIAIESKTDGTVDIYDVQGRIIRQFDYEKGHQRIIWDGKTADNKPATSGIYLIGRKGDRSGQTTRVIYLK